MLQSLTCQPSKNSKPESHWPTFTEILYNLHQEKLYIRAEQLAEFMLMHGLPVDLKYVPPHLQEKAKQLNANYQGNMARLREQPDEYFWYEDNLKEEGAI